MYWVEVLDPGRFAITLDLEELIPDHENSPLLEQVMFDLNATVIDAVVVAKYIELLLGQSYNSLNSFIYDDLNLGDHFEFTDLDVEDET